jgi:integration host factor subunit beta
MTKSELINLITTRQSQLLHDNVEAAVNVILKRLSNELAEGGRAEIRGFGTFSTRYRPPRIWYNPRTGQRILVDKKHVMHFKPAPKLKRSVDVSASQYTIKNQ